MKVGIDFVKIWLGLADDDPSGYASSYVDVAPAPDDAAPTEPVVVTGKTYTPSGDGSVGLQVDPFVFEDGIGAQASSRRIVLSGLEANSKYRTNVALFLTPGSTGKRPGRRPRPRRLRPRVEEVLGRSASTRTRRSSSSTVRTSSPVWRPTTTRGPPSSSTPRAAPPASGPTPRSSTTSPRTRPSSRGSRRPEPA